MSEIRRNPSSRRRHGIPHARAVVLWALAGLAAVQWIGHLVTTRRPILRDPQHYARVDHLRASQRDNPAARQAVFFGSSRTQWGLQVPALEAALAGHPGGPVTVHNWGTGGMTLPYFLLVWDRLERDGVRPDLVVLEVLPANLLNPSPNGNLQKSRFPPESLDSADLALLERDFELWEGTKTDQWLAALNPWHSRRLSILNGGGGQRLVPASHLVSLTPHLGSRVHIDPAQRPVYAERRRNTYLPLTQLPLQPTPVTQALEKLIVRIKRANVRAAMLLMPEGPDFRSMYPPGRREEVLAYLQGLASEHQITLLNAWDWYDSEEPFMDSHHFLAESADEFSARLGRELLAPLLDRPGGE